MTVLSTGNTLQRPQWYVSAFPWKPQKGLEAVGMANKCVKVYLANKQTDHKEKKIYQAGEKIMVPAWEVIECFELRHFWFCLG